MRRLAGLLGGFVTGAVVVASTFTLILRAALRRHGL